MFPVPCVAYPGAPVTYVLQQQQGVAPHHQFFAANATRACPHVQSAGDDKENPKDDGSGSEGLLDVGVRGDAKTLEDDDRFGNICLQTAIDILRPGDYMFRRSRQSPAGDRDAKDVFVISFRRSGTNQVANTTINKAGGGYQKNGGDVVPLEDLIAETGATKPVSFAKIENMEFYANDMKKQEARSLLKSGEPGSWLIRRSEQYRDENSFVFSNMEFEKEFVRTAPGVYAWRDIQPLSINGLLHDMNQKGAISRMDVNRIEDMDCYAGDITPEYVPQILRRGEYLIRPKTLCNEEEEDGGEKFLLSYRNQKDSSVCHLEFVRGDRNYGIELEEGGFSERKFTFAQVMGQINATDPLSFTEVEKMDGYAGPIGREQAEALLHDDGTYLIRKKTNSQFVLSSHITRELKDSKGVMTANDKTLHVIFTRIQQGVYKQKSNKGLRFVSMNGLLQELKELRATPVSFIQNIAEDSAETGEIDQGKVDDGTVVIYY